MSKERLFSLDQVRGCILGGAVGDALGYPVEFMSRNQILQRYGNEGITRHVLNGEGLAEISDDTQMTLFTATGMLFASTRGHTHGICGSPDNYIRRHYVDWYHTQIGVKYDDTRNDSWLSWEPRMYANRAPGNTCMSALEAIEKGRRVENNSMGCGGVMRVAPVAVTNDFCYTSDALMVALGGVVAGITHCHPLGKLPAAAFVMILRKIVKEKCPRNLNCFAGLVQRTAMELKDIRMDVVEDSQTYGEAYPVQTDSFKNLLLQAVDLAVSGRPDSECISTLGEGWTADEALAIAVFCALRHMDSFKDAVIAAVNHDGDSDSTGSICGNIMGLFTGASGIPDCYLEHLEIKDLIEEVCEDIYYGCRIAEYGNLENISDEEARDWELKYIDRVSVHADHRPSYYNPR